MHQPKRIAMKNFPQVSLEKMLRRFIPLRLGVRAIRGMLCMFGCIVEESDVLADARKTFSARGAFHFRTLFGCQPHVRDFGSWHRSFWAQVDLVWLRNTVLSIAQGLLYYRNERENMFFSLYPLARKEKFALKPAGSTFM